MEYAQWGREQLSSIHLSIVQRSPDTSKWRETGVKIRVGRREGSGLLSARLITMRTPPGPMKQPLTNFGRGRIRRRFVVGKRAREAGLFVEVSMQLQDINSRHLLSIKRSPTIFPRSLSPSMIFFYFIFFNIGPSNISSW